MSGALVARIGILRARSPPPLPRILISQAGALDQRPDHGDRGRATAGTSGARVVAAQGLVATPDRRGQGGVASEIGSRPSFLMLSSARYLPDCKALCESDAPLRPQDRPAEREFITKEKREFINKKQEVH